jgi:glutamine synthetase adenylyltransferase
MVKESLARLRPSSTLNPQVCWHFPGAELIHHICRDAAVPKLVETTGELSNLTQRYSDCGVLRDGIKITLWITPKTDERGRSRLLNSALLALGKLGHLNSFTSDIDLMFSIQTKGQTQEQRASG